ncbi:MAG: AI-2E family transporter [Myxococcota bacterium]|nr:AI-2E family transporter [Myxococcota bacterium]
MRDVTHDPERLRRVVLIALAVLISVVFLWMIADFLIVLLLGALAAGMARPYYKGLLRRFPGKKNLAAGICVSVLLFAVILPLAAFGTLVAFQLLELGKTAEPWLREQISAANSFQRMQEHYPWLSSFAPYRDQIVAKLGELGSWLGTWAVGAVTAAASGTLTFFLMLFVLLYAAFFFLVDGRENLRTMLYYLPLPSEDEDRLVERFVSVARATLKGTMVIGLIQGALGGLGFWVAGINGAAVWAAAMAGMSVIPGLGTAVIWVPGVAFLLIFGHYTAGIGLLIWCGTVVSGVDNFLRPWLVGKDTKMSDLVILISTLGGIALFGPVGFVIGPIVAALFVTTWEIYGEAFRDVLPEAGPLSIPTPTPPVAPPPKDKPA